MIYGLSTNISARSPVWRARRRQVPCTTIVFEADAGTHSLISLSAWRSTEGDFFVHAVPGPRCRRNQALYLPFLHHFRQRTPDRKLSWTSLRGDLAAVSDCASQ